MGLATELQKRNKKKNVDSKVRNHEEKNKKVAEMT